MRTTTIDPLAEKYYSISAYAWCGNNPVNAIDPDGRDWKVEREVINGVTHYKLSVNAVLYNNSSDSIIDLLKLSAGISAQIMSLYNFENGDVKVSMDFNIKVVNSVDDISNTDHVFQIVDQSTLPKNQDGTTMAQAETNGQNIKNGTDLANNIIAGTNRRSIAHELGHTGGLPDVNKNPKGVGPGAYNNLMMQSEPLQRRGLNPNNSTTLTPYQINSIYENRGNLNQNSPVSSQYRGYTLKQGVVFTPIISKSLRR